MGKIKSPLLLFSSLKLTLPKPESKKSLKNDDGEYFEPSYFSNCKKTRVNFFSKNFVGFFFINHNANNRDEKKIPFFSQKINPPPQPTLKYLKHGEFFPDDVKKEKEWKMLLLTLYF